MKKIIYSTILFSVFLFIPFFPAKSFAAASSGLLLWYGTLVPTLLPVMICSNLLVLSKSAALIAAPLHRLLAPLLGLSVYGSYAFAVGFLCGYPMGAKVLADLRGEGLISREEAVYLTPPCSNVSPSFVLSFLLPHMANAQQKLPTLIIVYGAPLLYALLTNPSFRRRNASRGVFQKKTSLTAPDFAMIDVSIVNSIQNITKLGGYVVLFSLLAAMIGLLPKSMTLWKVAGIGITEITNGIAAIAAAPIAEKTKYLLLIMTTVFGGLCCVGQSQSMLREIGLTLPQYLKAKLCITGIALLLALCYVIRLV